MVLVGKWVDEQIDMRIFRSYCSIFIFTLPLSRNWQHRSYVKMVGLIVLDEIHLLGDERGPILEVIVSR